MATVVHRLHHHPGESPDGLTPVPTCTIDGDLTEFLPGETILEATRRIGHRHHVPTLCYDPQLDPFGACRVCMVEVEGVPKPVAACHTPLREGMVINTHTERVQRIRRNVVELLLSDLPEESRTSAQYGRNEFHAIVNQVHADGTKYAGGIRKSDVLAHHQHGQTAPDHVRLDHPYLGLDLAKCIVCSRCVRACDEVQGSFALTIEGRGFASAAVPGAKGTFAESDCVACGACANTCPTGAIFDKGYLEAQTNHADKEVTTTCSYCGVGCNFHVQIKDGKVFAVKPDRDGRSNEGHLCLKGRFAFRFAQSPDRLNTPLIRNNATGALEPASWEAALQLIASEFTRIMTESGPDALAGISSARGTNEENFLLQKFMRVVIGTNNVDCCARVCHSPTAYGMRQTFGTGAATNSFMDIDEAKLLFIVGANPTHGHPVIGARMKQAVLNGAKLIVVDPRRTELASYADVHLALKPGTNVPLLTAMANVIVREELTDEAFIRDHTEGWNEYRDFIWDKTPEWAAPITGVPADLIRWAARMYATSGASLSAHGLGVSEHYQGSYGVMLLADLAMMTGNVGRPGTGVNPLRGQNNVQGAADMGAQPDYITGYIPIDSDEGRAKAKALWGIDLNPHKGLKQTHMYDAVLDGRLKAMWLIGQDLAQTDADTGKVEAAFEKMEFLVVQELFLTETCKYADVVLPASSFLEKTGTFTNAERRVQLIREAIPPPGEAKADWEIIQLVAQAMGHAWHYTHPSEILDEIGQIDPRMAGIHFHRLEEGGLQWPVPTDDHPGTRIVHTGGEFSRGRGKFVITDYVASEETVTPEFPFLMTTGRLLQHYNAGTMTRRTGNAELITRDLMELNPADAARLGIDEGEYVQVASRRGAIVVPVDITTRIPVGTLFLTFHFPEVLINLITSDVREVNTSCPEYKVVAVRVTKIPLDEQIAAEQVWRDRVGELVADREQRLVEADHAALPAAE